MNILLLSSGGGGGNILRSLKMLFARDVAAAQKSDARFAERLRRAITARFIDTNEFSLNDVPRDERLLIGAPTSQRFGSGHNPLVAHRALEESRDEVERLISKFAVIVIIATGGKGTGAGTAFPLAQMARAQKKLVIPIFVRPSFERHEVDKRRYDHAVQVTDAFDAAGIRLMEVLNDCGYCDRDPQPQSVVWERMNVPIARGLRGLLYVLGDLSQVDPSDLAILMAGPGRMRIGFAEIDPPPGAEARDAAIEEAARQCWQNAYYAFDRPVGTSLVCIQGEWSNLIDARIKGCLAALATAGAPDHSYSPLHARAFQTPRPWGITALFTEDTGVHRPLELDWTVSKKIAIQPVEAASAPAMVPVNEPEASVTDVSRQRSTSADFAARRSKARERVHVQWHLGSGPSAQSSGPHGACDRGGGQHVCDRGGWARGQKASRNVLVSLGVPALLPVMAPTAPLRSGRHRDRAESCGEARPPAGAGEGSPPRRDQGHRR